MTEFKEYDISDKKIEKNCCRNCEYLAPSCFDKVKDINNDYCCYFKPYVKNIEMDLIKRYNLNYLHTTFRLNETNELLKETMLELQNLKTQLKEEMVTNPSKIDCQLKSIKHFSHSIRCHEVRAEIFKNFDILVIPDNDFERYSSFTLLNELSKADTLKILIKKMGLFNYLVVNKQVELIEKSHKENEYFVKDIIETFLEDYEEKLREAFPNESQVFDNKIKEEASLLLKRLIHQYYSCREYYKVVYEEEN